MSKRLLSVLIHPFFFTIILFFLQLGLFLWITLRPFSISPPDRAYYIARGQGAYPSYIRQGKEDAWSLYNPYTTRPEPSIYVRMLYVVVGKIARVTSLDAIAMYMITRVAAGLVLFLATSWLITIVLPANFRLLAVFFTLGLEPGPLITAIKNIPSLLTAPPAIFSYFQQELAMRHFGLPHNVLAEALGLFLVGHVFLYAKKSSWQRLCGIGLLTIAGALVMPAYNSILILTVFTVWLLLSKKILPAFLTIILCFAGAGLFTKLQMNQGGLWQYFYLDEKRWVTDRDILINYFSSLLLYLPAVLFFIISLPRLWGRMASYMKLLIILAAAWVAGPLLFLPMTHISAFPLANFRLVDGYAYVPMGILAALAVKKKYVIFLMLAASLFLTYSYTSQTFAEQHNIWTNVYPLKEEWDAIRFLDTVPKKSGVLVTKYFGEIIPAYATVRVFLGETPGAFDWDERYYEALRFYSGQLTDSEARTLLTRENISYIFWGQNEKQFLKTPALYPNILLPVFHNPAVTIFVQKQ